MKIVLPWTHNLLRYGGMGGYGYKIIGLDELLQIADENGGVLNVMFARQVTKFKLEGILEQKILKRAIEEADKRGYNLKEINSDIMQWIKDNFSRKNPEKGIFVEPQTFDGKTYYIAAQSKSQLDKNIEIGDVYLDINKIRKMIKEEEPRFGYMEEPLEDLIREGKVTMVKVNTNKGKVIETEGLSMPIFWGLETLYYTSIVSEHIFGVDNYKIMKFEDSIKLDGSEYSIFGYGSTFEYGGIKIRSRIYDGSHIYQERAEKYGIEKNGYIALAELSSRRRILLEGNPEREDPKIRDFYKKARDVTGYDILILLVDEQKLIERGIIGEKDYVKFIGKNEIKKFIDIISHIYRL
jgi:hypothetical protein